MEVVVPYLAILLSRTQLIKEETVIVEEDIIQSKTDMPFQHTRLAAMKMTFDKSLF